MTSELMAFDKIEVTNCWMKEALQKYYCVLLQKTASEHDVGVNLKFPSDKLHMDTACYDAPQSSY